MIVEFNDINLRDIRILPEKKQLKFIIGEVFIISILSSLCFKLREIRSRQENTTNF